MDYKWALVDIILNLVAFLNLKPTRFFFVIDAKCIWEGNQAKSGWATPQIYFLFT
jgi:hypothetical protein